MLAFSLLALFASTQGHPAHGIRPPTGRLLVVGGPGGIPDIQSAVDEAYDGHTILVRSGTYPGFSIVDKGISLTADVGASVDVGPVRVRDLGPAKAALLAGLLIHGATDAAALEATNNAGGLRLESCWMFGAAAHALGNNQWTTPQQGALLDADANVALVMCTAYGGAGRGGYDVSGGPGATALDVRASSVALLECVLEGGSGGDVICCYPWPGGAGSDGVNVDGGFVYSSGSEIRGGAGGDGGDNYMCFGGDQAGDGGAGGAGVRVSSSANAPDVVLLGTLVVGGVGGAGGIDHSNMSGYPCYGDGLPGADGSAISAPDGAVQSLMGAPRQMVAPRVAREYETVTAHCYGRSGDVVQIFSSGSTDFDYVPSFNGVQLISLPDAAVIASGTIPSGGALDLVVPLPNVPGDAKPLFLQAYFRDSSNRRYVASQVTLVELDSRY